MTDAETISGLRGKYVGIELPPNIHDSDNFSVAYGDGNNIKVIRHGGSKKMRDICIKYSNSGLVLPDREELLELRDLLNTVVPPPSSDICHIKR